MARVKITLDGWKCERCGHEWVPRQRVPHREEPKTCPNCRSSYWNEPRIMPKRDRK